MFLIRQKHARKTAIMLYRVLKTPLDDFFDKILSSFVKNTLLQSFRARPNTKNSFQFLIIRKSPSSRPRIAKLQFRHFAPDSRNFGFFRFIFNPIARHQKKQYFDPKSAFIEINSTLYKQFFTSAYPVWHFCSFLACV